MTSKTTTDKPNHSWYLRTADGWKKDSNSVPYTYTWRWVDFPHLPEATQRKLSVLALTNPGDSTVHIAGVGHVYESEQYRGLVMRINE